MSSKMMYEEGQILIPREPNRFWKAFKIDSYTGNTGKDVKYDVLCYSNIRDQGIDNKMMIMAQSIMQQTTRIATEEEIEKLEL